MPNGSCQNCGHNCLIIVTAKTKDEFSMVWPGGKRQKGYVPPHRLLGLRSDDYNKNFLHFRLCTVCGQLQGRWPKEHGQGHLEKYAEPRFWEVILCYGVRCLKEGDPTWASCYFYSKALEDVEDYIEKHPDEFGNPIEFFVKDIDSGENIMDDDYVWEV